MRAPHVAAVVVCLALLVLAGPSACQNQWPEFRGPAEARLGITPACPSSGLTLRTSSGGLPYRD